jgi:hypothetical protein
VETRLSSSRPSASEDPKSSDKRESIDNQEAFIEFKQSTEGRKLDEKVFSLRKVTKDSRINVKTVTDNLNKTKINIDSLKQKIDRKENERKMRFHNEQL